MDVRAGGTNGLLDLWERALGRGARAREDALIVADPPRGLGARNLALLETRAAHFGRIWPLRSRCPTCDAEAEFEVDCAILADTLRRQPTPDTAMIEWRGRRIAGRAPTSDDLDAVATCGRADVAGRRLLARCLEGDPEVDALSDAEVEELGDRLEGLDPGAVVAFDVACPACGQAWQAAFDVGHALWTEVQRAAEQSLLEVDALARAYGWTEAEVMTLSPVRRAAYLQLVEAG